ncbi:MAG: threonine synthase [Pseudomonadota bacterium]
MNYDSTRGNAPTLGFADTILQGLARDGGLYLPETYPVLTSDQIAAFAGRGYADVAEAVISPFVDGDIGAGDFRAMLDNAYAGFRHPAVTPLIQIGPNAFVLELFHGPTLAFKDVAMQLLGRMMDHLLKDRGGRATIVGATSGDTGGAAIEAFRGLDAVDIFILYPHGRVSDVQRRQMTTVAAENVHALAIEGTFDDCQAIVKGMFTHEVFRDRVALSGVNSINWGRIVAQAVYYFVAAVALGAPHRRVSFSVPTGNFGDILAGYIAKRMGLPIERLVIATNVNDILARTLETGRYGVGGVVATQSPSMDIQVSSNFERLLFEATGRDADAVRQMMAGLKQSGSFTIPEPALDAIRQDFDAVRVDEHQTVEIMAQVLRDSGYLLDPHTAVGVAAGQDVAHDPAVPMVTLATAHPAKFPDAVERATGQHPALPAGIADLADREERFTVTAADQAAVERLILERSRLAA